MSDDHDIDMSDIDDSRVGREEAECHWCHTQSTCAVGYYEGEMVLAVCDACARTDAEAGEAANALGGNHN